MPVSLTINASSPLHKQVQQLSNLSGFVFSRGGGGYELSQRVRATERRSKPYLRKKDLQLCKKDPILGQKIRTSAKKIHDPIR